MRIEGMTPEDRQAQALYFIELLKDGVPKVKGLDVAIEDYVQTKENGELQKDEKPTEEAILAQDYSPEVEAQFIANHGKRQWMEGRNRKERRALGQPKKHSKPKLKVKRS